MAKTTLLRKLFDGRLRLETQNDNPMIYGRTYLQGKLRTFRTMHTNEHSAAKAAGDWYLSLLHQVRTGDRLDALLFVDAADQFIADCDANDEPSALQRRNYRHKLNLLMTHLDGVRITDIDTDWLEQLRVKRSKVLTPKGTPVKPTTIKKDLMFISSVLGFCKRKKLMDTLPDFPSFDGKWTIDGKSRPPFTVSQYKTLLRTAWKRTKEPDLNPRTRRQRQELYAMILVMMGAGLRPGEAYSLCWRDARLDQIEDDGLFHMTVRGKHGKGKPEDAFMTRVGYLALRRLFKSRDKKTTLGSPIITEHHNEGFKALLKLCHLHVDKKTGSTRDMKSLRPSALTFTLERQSPSPDYRKTAKWARTSPAMLVKWYDDLNPQHAARAVLLPKRKVESA